MDNLKKLIGLLKEEQKSEEEVTRVVEVLTETATVQAMASVLEVLGKNENGNEDLSSGDQVREEYEAKTGKKLDDLVIEKLDKLAEEYILKKNQPQV